MRSRAQSQGADSSAPEAIPPSKRGTKFVADAMLGSMARKLRAFGFDTVYYKNGDDSVLLELAASQGRILLTSDRALFRLAIEHGVRSFFMEGTNDSKRLASLRSMAAAGSLGLSPGPPRCSMCNGELSRRKPSDLTGTLPRGILRRHRLFYRCSSCGRMYWKGSHWKKLRWLERRLGQKPDTVDSRRRQSSSRSG